MDVAIAFVSCEQCVLGVIVVSGVSFARLMPDVFTQLSRTIGAAGFKQVRGLRAIWVKVTHRLQRLADD